LTIPKLIHRIWFGQNAIPPAYEGYWLAWQRQYPDYTFKTWRESDIDESFVTRKKIAEADGMVRKADIARYEILYKHGGVYLDCDVMPYHYLDWQKIEAGLIVCNEVESEEFCSIGVIAAIPGNGILERALHALIEKPLNLHPPNVETGPFFFKEMLAFGLHFNLRTETFYPYPFNEPFASILGRDLAETYGIHVWRGAWLKEEEVLQNILDRLKWGDLIEPASLAADAGLNVKQLVDSYVELVGNARRSCIAATGHSILAKYFKIESTKYFEFLKCGFHLLENEKDSTVWQIGAADGILVDPLRPLVVNHDPRDAMLEPNPHLFGRLKQNYARNKHITFINCALGSTPGHVKLNAVNPDKATLNNLPDWVLGISSFYTDRNAIGGLTIDETLKQSIQDNIEATTVEMIDPAGLLALTENRAPSIVVIDAEGMDGEILTSILNSGIRPKIIRYEIQCMPKPEQEVLTGRLNKEYVQISYGNDVVAYRTDFFLSYCNDLYARHGISTIYEESLKFITGS